jgi:enediyne biosynthesis protein E4
VQFAPVCSFLVDDFNHDGFKDIVAAGNFDGNTPAIRRLDASFGNYLTGDENGAFTLIEPSASGFAVYGEARDIKMIQAGDSKWIIISRNNVPMRFLKNDQQIHFKK